MRLSGLLHRGRSPGPAHVGLRLVILASGFGAGGVLKTRFDFGNTSGWYSIRPPFSPVCAPRQESSFALALVSRGRGLFTVLLLPAAALVAAAAATAPLPQPTSSSLVTCSFEDSQNTQHAADNTMRTVCRLAGRSSFILVFRLLQQLGELDWVGTGQA